MKEKKMRKVVYNNCFGGFGLSLEAEKLYCKYANVKEGEINGILRLELSRHDKALVKVVEELEEKANGSFAVLKIKELAKEEKYFIDEYDGHEVVVTPKDIEWL